MTLRAIAVAIVAAAIVDPSITVTTATRARVAVVNLEPDSAAAARVCDALASNLGAAYDVQRRVTSDAAAAILVGRSYPADALREALPVATVTMPDDRAVRIVRVSAPRDVPAATAIRVDVDLDARGIAAQTTNVIARVAGLDVARVSHRWTADRERWRASLDIVPIGDPPYTIRLDAGADSADIAVGLRTEPLRVEFYDPRPSWATTFVRRALEADARFHIESLGFSSRGVAVRTSGDVPLADSRLASFDALVVGGLEQLTPADVRALDAFMRDRGGAVALVPDRRIDAGAARDLLPDTVERLLEQPAMLVPARGAAPLQASELLVMRGQVAGADILAATPGAETEPVIVSMPRGAGRLVVSGAMDAWRFRAAGPASFDRFWQSLMAGLALAVPPPLDVGVRPAILSPGGHADVIVRSRAPGVSGVSATIDAGEPVRLWPDAEAGVYRGRLTAPAKPGRSTIEARVIGSADRAASRVVTVVAGVRQVRGDVSPALSMLAASHRGIDVPPGRITDAVRFVRAAAQTPRAPIERHPMRSIWWIVPLTGVLSAEWWLRRRRGLR